MKNCFCAALLSLLLCPAGSPVRAADFAFTAPPDARLTALMRRTAPPFSYDPEVQKVIAGPQAVTEKKDIVYGRAGDESLLLDAWLPKPAAARPCPAVLLIHGGGWTGGDRKFWHQSPFAKQLAEEGFAVFSISYRLVKPAKDGQPVKNAWPAAIDDCQRAVRWLRRHAAEYGIDPQQIAAMGDSAGGHLVSLLGTTETRDNSDSELAAHSSRVQAVVNIYGPGDLTRPFPSVETGGIDVQGLVDNFTGKGDTARQREASPQMHINEKTVPFLIFQGDADRIVPPAQTRDFHAALRRAGRDSTFIEFPGEGHGFSKPENIERMNRGILQFLRRTLQTGK